MISGNGIPKKTSGKQKLPLAFIEDPIRRKNCFKKRSRGLLKKGLELKILTDSDVSVYMFFPDTDKEYTLNTSDPDVKRLPPDIGKLVKQHTQSLGLANSKGGELASKRPFDVIPLRHSPGSGTSGVEDEDEDDDDDDNENQDENAARNDGPLRVNGVQPGLEQLQIYYSLLEQGQLQFEHSLVQQQQLQFDYSLLQQQEQQEQQQLQFDYSLLQQQQQQQQEQLHQKRQQLQLAVSDPELLSIMDQPWSVLANGGGGLSQDVSEQALPVVPFGNGANAMEGGEIPPQSLEAQQTIFANGAHFPVFDAKLTEEQKSTIFPDFDSDFENVINWL